MCKKEKASSDLPFVLSIGRSELADTERHHREYFLKKLFLKRLKNKNMIHPAISKTEIAFRYYKELTIFKNYSRETSLKLFHQDKNIDNKLVMSIIKDIFKEQKEMMK